MFCVRDVIMCVISKLSFWLIHCFDNNYVFFSIALIKIWNKKYGLLFLLILWPLSWKWFCFYFTFHCPKQNHICLPLSAFIKTIQQFFSEITEILLKVVLKTRTLTFIITLHSIVNDNNYIFFSPICNKNVDIKPLSGTLKVESL